MAKAPAFQFYPGDWLLKTKGMSAAARGCYIDMLATSWAIGPIKDTPRDLVAAMSLSPFDPSFEAVWGEIKPKWDLGPNGWTNEKLEAVRAEQEAYRQRQSDKGKKSAAHRINSTRAQPEINHGSTTVQPDGQPDTQPEVNPSSSPLTFDLDLRSSSSPLPQGAEPRAPETSAEIAEILAIAPFDRTREQGERLAAHRGDTLRPWGQKPQRVRTGVDANVNNHRGCQGQGVLPSCGRGKALCVPAFVGQEWLDQCGGDVSYIASFVSSVVTGTPENIPIGDPAKFWRAKWDAAHRQPNERLGKGEQAAAEGRKLLAKYAAEGRL